MLFYFSVAVIDIGDELSADLSNKITSIPIKAHQPTFITRDHKNATDKVMMVKMALQSYKDRNLPYILILNTIFLDLVWKSSEKTQILKMLTNYPTKFCLHIWLDVDENDVSSYSTFLQRNDVFKRVSYSKLSKYDDTQLLDEILVLMLGKFKEPNTFQ